MSNAGILRSALVAAALGAATATALAAVGTKEKFRGERNTDEMGRAKSCSSADLALAGDSAHRAGVSCAARSVVR